MRYSKAFLLVAFITLLCFSAAVAAFALNGSMTKNSDGSYSVVVQNSYGHQYTGVADDEGDGTFDLSVKDNEGHSFSGTALDNENGGYILDMQNDQTGDNATGTVDVN